MVVLDIFFGKYLDAWIFAGLMLLCLGIVIITIEVAKLEKEDLYEAIEDDFVKEHGYSYDYAFVFKVYGEDEIAGLNEAQRKFTMKNIIDRCNQALMQTKCFYSCQRDEIYVKVRVSPSRLEAEADRIDYKLLLNKDQLRAVAQNGKMEDHEWVWAPIRIKDEYKISPYDPFEFIYAKFDTSAQLRPLYTTYLITNNPNEQNESKKKYQVLRPVDR